MKGFLSFLVLRLISKRDMSGQDIRKELEQRKGCMPSAGTIYPVLKNLSAAGMIKSNGTGKIKQYHLTEKGKKELATATKKFVCLFCDMKEEFY